MGSSPGPWRWEHGNIGQERGLFDAARKHILDARHYTSPADATLIRLAPDMASLLRELEWADAGVRCWVCRGSARDLPAFGTLPEIKKGHAPDCRLAALLSELPK